MSIYPAPLFNGPPYDITNWGTRVTSSTSTSTSNISPYGEAAVSQREVLLDWSINDNVNDPLTTRLVYVGGGLSSISNGAVICSTGLVSAFGQAGFTPVGSWRCNTNTMIECNFTGSFTTDNFLALQRTGLVSLVENYYFGCIFTGDIAIGFDYGGIQAVYQATVTVGATAAGNATLTLPNLAGGTTNYTLPIISSVGATSPTAHTAYQIVTQLRALGPPGIYCENVGSLINFIWVFPQPIAGSPGYTGVNLGTLTFALQTNGTSTTNIIVPRSQWNRSNPTSKPSGVTTNFDYTKINAYKIQIVNIPNGNINYYLFNANTDQYELVHSIDNLNALTSNANWRTYGVFSSLVAGFGFGIGDVRTNTTNCNIYQDCQVDNLTFKRDSISVNKQTNGTVETNIVCIKTCLVINQIYCIRQLRLRSLSALTSTAQQCVINIYKYQYVTPNAYAGNGSTTNYTNWQNQNTTSILQYDSTSSTITNLASASLVFSCTISNTNSQVIDLAYEKIYINDSEVLVVTAISSSGSPIVYVSLSFIEN